MKRVAVTAAYSLLLREFEAPESFSNQLRRADNFISLAVSCSQMVLEASPTKNLPADQTGIFIGTAYGPLETNFSSLGSLINNGEGQISPTLFSHSVYNAAAGYVARLLDIHGPALTITTYTWPFLTAMNQARLSILAGRVRRAVILTVETYSALLEDAYIRSQHTSELPWEPGAAALVLEDSAQAHTSLCRLGELHIEEKACDSDKLLTRTGEEWSGAGLPPQKGSHPLAYAYALVEAIRQLPKDSPCSNWRINAPFGSVSIEIQG